jgi:flagellar hook assembly protein FlgD
VKLAVYNTLGQLVRTLVNEARSPGQHEVRWDGRDESGRAAASGVYLARMEAGSFRQTQKMLLLK